MKIKHNPLCLRALKHTCLMETKSNIEKSWINSYLTDIEDTMQLCIYAQKNIRAGNFGHGITQLQHVIDSAGRLKKKIEVVI